MLLNLINYQTLVCSKASRIVEVAKPSSVVDFGLRRAPGPEAGIRAARAAYIAGAVGTSNVEAAKRFGIPVSGTMAHSFVMAHTNELNAFRAWCKAYPEGTTLLIDTYNVVQGARNACQVVREGAALKAVRIDSGDFADNTYRVRAILNDAGLEHVHIIVSGDMNEEKIRALKRAPIDGFGVGTEMVTARPEAALSGVYKLVEVDGRPCIKLSSGKKTLPGRKQVWRCEAYDILGKADDVERGRPLLENLMVNGKRLHSLPSLRDILSYCRNEIEKLPASIVDSGSEYTVRISENLNVLQASFDGLSHYPRVLTSRSGTGRDGGRAPNLDRRGALDGDASPPGGVAEAETNEAKLQGS